MAYLKLPKTCGDHAVGFQTVNQALANNDALFFDQLNPNHSVGINGNSYGDPFLVPGRHDDVLIARTVANFVVDSTGLVPVVLALVSGPMIALTPQRIAVGKWKVYVTTPQLISAAAAISGPTASVPRAAMCFTSSDATGPFIMVSTWNVAGGILADYAFSLAIWALAVA